MAYDDMHPVTAIVLFFVLGIAGAISVGLFLGIFFGVLIRVAHWAAGG